MGRGQAERLMPMLDEILSETGVEWNDLGAIGVGIGPGNFTGIRISVATARGLALALGIPAIGVSRFDSLAFGQPRPCITLVDAPRGRLYLQRFDESGAETPSLSTLGELTSMARHQNLRWIGAHAGECASRLSGVVSEPSVTCVEAIARIAAIRIETNTTPPAPLYIRPADAAPARDAAPELLDDA